MAEHERQVTTRQRRRKNSLLLLGPVIVLVGAAWLYFTSGRYVGTDNAYVQADILAISSEVSGRVIAAPVGTNDVVEAGQLLLAIDAEPYRIALAQAQAQLLAARDEVNALRAAYGAVQAQLKRSQHEVDFQRRELRRLQGLAAENFVSAAQIDAAEQKLQMARSEFAALEQEASRIKASLSGNPDLPLEQHPRYLAALAQLDKAQLDLARTELRAPKAGVVGSGPPLPGDLVTAGRPLFSLVLLDDVWVDANLKETDLAKVRVGQKATVKVDAYPGQVWQARVGSISPASGSQFSLLPPQNASGNWVKVVQRIPVRLALVANEDQPPLRAGMSAVVSIEVLSTEPAAKEFGQR